MTEELVHRFFVWNITKSSNRSPWLRVHQVLVPFWRDVQMVNGTYPPRVATRIFQRFYILSTDWWNHIFNMWETDSFTQELTVLKIGLGSDSYSTASFLLEKQRMRPQNKSKTSQTMPTNVTLNSHMIDFFPSLRFLQMCFCFGLFPQPSYPVGTIATWRAVI